MNILPGERTDNVVFVGLAEKYSLVMSVDQSRGMALTTQRESLSRFARRTDSNQAEIVEALRKLGYHVQPGHDDLLVYKLGKLVQVECKTGTGRLTEGQEKLKKELPGSYIVVTHFQQVVNFFRYGILYVPDNTEFS